MELTYPDGLYQYVYKVCFFHPVHIFAAFYYEMYFSGLLGILLFITSVNYWQKPYINSLARTLDVVCVHITIPHQYYLALYATNNRVCTGLVTAGILMYPLSNYLHHKNNYLSVMCHCLLHLCISIGLCFMYKDYYDNNRTKSPPSQSEIELENALALFLSR